MRYGNEWQAGDGVTFAQMNQRLASDHEELDTLLNELCTALEGDDVREIYQRLDLFWARLAIHIRAEHLHLFPAVLRCLSGPEDVAQAPSLSQAQNTIKELRRDHDFFMHELAGAMLAMRALLKTTDRRLIDEELRSVRTTIAAVRERLSDHNNVEENQVYLWPERLLTEVERAALREGVEMELRRIPPRFSQ